MGHGPKSPTSGDGADPEPAETDPPPRPFKTMITGELKAKVDSIWNKMWSGGISNPLSVIEQTDTTSSSSSGSMSWTR